MSKPLDKNLESHWKKVAETFTFSKKWNSIFEGSFESGKMSWFSGAELNITENCLDRHQAKLRSKKAVIFIPNNDKEPSIELTYGELLVSVSRFASMLKKQGIKKGDVVCFYMGMTPELLIGILACARLGAIHTVVFGGFSPQSLHGRLIDSKSKLIVTHNGAYRADKIIPLKSMVDDSLSKFSPTNVEKVIVVNRIVNDPTFVTPMTKDRDLIYENLIKDTEVFVPAVAVGAEDPLFILYTSGSTGKPKGLLHTAAGYMVHAGESFKEVFKLNDKDIFWCTADIGWITGHTYLTYGPLLNGKTTVLFEGTPTYPSATRLWEEIEKHKITHLYTAPTAIRALIKFGEHLPDKFPLKSLKLLGSVGEPINEEAWQWYHKHVGKSRCNIIDSWWQTETGGIMISPLANEKTTKPAFATKPIKGIELALLDEKGNDITPVLGVEAEGLLAIKTPFPSIARTIYGDHERYVETYFKPFKGYYFTGDGAKVDKDGDYRITGRVDDVINVSGHRLGTAEIEDAINLHHGVVESAVIGFPHEIKGQGIFGFVLINAGAKIDSQAVKETVAKAIGAIARPDEILIVDALPKTRSGKIMRRVLRKIVENDLSNLGDTSTLLNPECVENIINAYQKLKEYNNSLQSKKKAS